MSAYEKLVKNLDPGIEAFKEGTLPQRLGDYAQFRVMLRALLIGAEIDFTGHEAWSEAQFRRLDQGRGPAVVAALGRERAEQMVHDAVAYAEWYMGEQYSSVVLEAGMRQVLADVLAVAILDGERSQKAFNSLQKRVLAGYRRLAEKKNALKQYVPAIDALFQGDLPDSGFGATPVGGLTFVMHMFDSE